MIDRLLRSRRFVLGSTFLAIALAGLVLGYATGGREPVSSLAPAPAPSQPYLRGAIQSISGDQLTLTTDAGARILKLPSGAPVETLRAIDPSSIAMGDWLNGGAVRNPQTVFAITALVIIRQAQLGAAAR